MGRFERQFKKRISGEAEKLGTKATDFAGWCAHNGAGFTGFSDGDVSAGGARAKARAVNARRAGVLVVLFVVVAAVLVFAFVPHGGELGGMNDSGAQFPGMEEGGGQVRGMTAEEYEEIAGRFGFARILCADSSPAEPSASGYGTVYCVADGAPLLAEFKTEYSGMGVTMRVEYGEKVAFSYRDDYQKLPYTAKAGGFDVFCGTVSAADIPVTLFLVEGDGHAAYLEVASNGDCIPYILDMIAQK